MCWGVYLGFIVSMMTDITTPALLFSAISLIFLAYTNRFLAYAALVRSLKKEHEATPDASHLAQIRNLYLRMHLTRAMQILGVLSLLFSVFSMFLFYVGASLVATLLFGLGLLLLCFSLGLAIWEIHISVKALGIHLKDLRDGLIINPDEE